MISLLVDAGRSRVGYDDLTHACPKSISRLDTSLCLIHSPDTFPVLKFQKAESDMSRAYCQKEGYQIQVPFGLSSFAFPLLPLILDSSFPVP